MTTQKPELEQLTEKLLKRKAILFMHGCKEWIFSNPAWKMSGAVLLIYRNEGSFINLVTGKSESVDTLYEDARERIERAKRHGKPNSYTAARDFRDSLLGGVFQIPGTDIWISFAGEWQGESECLDIAFGLLIGKKLGLMTDDHVRQVITEHGSLQERLTTVFTHMLKACE